MHPFILIRKPTVPCGLIALVVLLGACVSPPKYTVEEAQQMLAEYDIPPTEYPKVPLNVGILLVPDLCRYGNVKVEEGIAQLMRSLFVEVNLLSPEDLCDGKPRPPVVIVPEVTRSHLYRIKDWAVRYNVTYSFWNQEQQKIWVGTYRGTGYAKDVTDAWHQAVQSQFLAAQQGIAHSRFWTLTVPKSTKAESEQPADFLTHTSVKELGNGEKQLIINLPGGAEMQFVKIPTGAFTMGSPPMEKGRIEMLEGLQYEIAISKPFYLGVYEVTRRQWQAVMGENPVIQIENPDWPITGITWYDCQQFIEKINKLGIGTFRLPSEAEWEHACRAGTTTRFYWGDDPDQTEIDDHAWYYKQSDGKKSLESHPVGLKKPNPWGLYDMSGGVEEWCENRFGGWSCCSILNRIDREQTWQAVTRGGNWMMTSDACRSASRRKFARDFSGITFGLRLLRECP